MSSFTLGRHDKNKCPGHGHVKEKGKQRDTLANSSLAAVNSFTEISTNIHFYSLGLAVVPDWIMEHGLSGLVAHGSRSFHWRFILVKEPWFTYLHLFAIFFVERALFCRSRIVQVKQQRLCKFILTRFWLEFTKVCNFIDENVDSVSSLNERGNFYLELILVSNNE